MSVATVSELFSHFFAVCIFVLLKSVFSVWLWCVCGMHRYLKRSKTNKKKIIKHQAQRIIHGSKNCYQNKNKISNNSSIIAKIPKPICCLHFGHVQNIDVFLLLSFSLSFFAYFHPFSIFRCPKLIYVITVEKWKWNRNLKFGKNVISTWTFCFA